MITVPVTAPGPPGFRARLGVHDGIGARRLMAEAASLAPWWPTGSGTPPSDRRKGGAMAAPQTVVDLAEKLAAFDEHWSPKIIGQVNDLHIKAVKLLGEFVWHQHDDTDELFMVLAGRLTIRLQGRDDVQVGPGQLFIVPRGLPHCPVATEECHLLLLEPAGTPNTGDQPESDRTAAGQWI
jgi:mannose-6-phosphate isomerase-like protein (cupin superfamily)